MTTQVQAVLFDLDGTLVGFDDDAYDRAMAGVCLEIGRRYGLDAEALSQAHRDKSIERWRDAGATAFRTATGDIVTGEAFMLEIWQQALGVVGCAETAAARLGYDAYWEDRR